MLLTVYAGRIAELSRLKSVRYVAVFKNEGKEAGASLVHSHSQVVAYNLIPEEIAMEIKAAGAYRKKHGRCAFCDMIKEERRGPRIAAENADFLALCPFASRFPFECIILPKKHRVSLAALGKDEISNLAGIMRTVLSTLGQLGAAFNYYLHYAPDGKDLHFHIEVVPRLSKLAGFEYCTGTIINTMAPEAAAEFFRNPQKKTRA